MIRTKLLGLTRLAVPEVGFGTYLYQGGPELLRQAIDLGAAFIDTAEYYENEETVGRALRGVRERVFVATKTHHWRRGEVLACAEASLRKLQIETIDLYQLHWPNSIVPIEETMSAFEELVDQGKVRHIGVSNFSLPELRRAEQALRKHRIVANQLRYSLVHRTIEPHLLPYCQRRDIAVIAYSPLAHRFADLQAADQQGALAQVAKDVGRTMAQVALNWCLVKPGVFVIPKTESAAHLAENCASSDWRLTDDQVQALNRGVRYRSRGRLEQALRRFVRGLIQRRQAWRERDRGRDRAQTA
jgi:diketogulonate reductase-like aldo/keto reductase